MRFQVDRAAHILWFWVKRDRQIRFEVALVKGNRQMGFQVDQVTHIIWFRLNEVAGWDLKWLSLKGITRWDFRLTETHIFFCSS